MELYLLRRRECGKGWAWDVDLPRSLTLTELADLARTCGGTYRVFHTLVWLDLPGGRIVASTVTPRMTLRLRQQHDAILAYLQSLPVAADSA
ncbi:MAG: hypothetical protein NZ821_09335 [Gloeomargarita sp. SKYB31]|nr:hypothetical protein [Gloeomargarita sp. SKYB31]